MTFTLIWLKIGESRLLNYFRRILLNIWRCFIKRRVYMYTREYLIIITNNDTENDVSVAGEGNTCRKGYRILHSNICSLLSKLPEVCILIDKYNLDIISVNETHLDDTILSWICKVSQCIEMTGIDVGEGLLCTSAITLSKNYVLIYSFRALKACGWKFLSLTAVLTWLAQCTGYRLHERNTMKKW